MLHFRDLHRDEAAFRHGVASVDDQVHQDLLELRGISDDDCRVLAAPDLETHRRGQDALHHRDESADHLGELDRLDLVDFSPGE